MCYYAAYLIIRFGQINILDLSAPATSKTVLQHLTTKRCGSPSLTPFALQYSAKHRGIFKSTVRYNLTSWKFKRVIVTATYMITDSHQVLVYTERLHFMIRIDQASRLLAQDRDAVLIHHPPPGGASSRL